MAADWLIEIGHSRLKLARYASREIGRTLAMPTAAFAEGLKSGAAFAQAPRPARAWLCAVPEESVVAPVLGALNNAGIDCRRVDLGSVPLPVQPAYAGLGVDRWLALQPAWRQYQSAFVVIDAGTATTIDAVNDRGVHLGGWILPGRTAARNGLIAAAPGLKRSQHSSDEVPFARPARDTAEAIERGLLLQQISALDWALGVLNADTESALHLVMTGGEAPILRAAIAAQLKDAPNTNAQPPSALESSFRTVCMTDDLVLQGLAMAVDYS